MKFKLDLSPAIQVILVAALSNLALSVIKFIGGVVGHSAALISDAVHSVSDLLTDVVALFTYRIGRIPRDTNHPYGHGRAESIGAAVIGLFIIIAGLGIAWESALLAVHLAGGHLPFEPADAPVFEKPPPTWIAAGCAFLSIVINEWLYRYTRRVGERENSPTLVANAWHHRSDAVSSVAALIGIGAALSGYPMMDPVAGVVVALMIIKAGYDIVRGGLRDLMDTSLEDPELQRIRQTVESTPGVLRSHDLRTRRIGGEVYMDVHVLVDRESSVTEGHQIGEAVRRRLIHGFKHVQDVLVHVDTEDDSGFEPLYPTDSEELKRLADPIIAATEGVLTRTRLRVHFHNGSVILEVFVRPENATPPDRMHSVLQEVQSRLLALPQVDEARIYLDLPLD